MREERQKTKNSDGEDDHAQDGDAQKQEGGQVAKRGHPRCGQGPFNGITLSAAVFVHGKHSAEQFFHSTPVGFPEVLTMTQFTRHNDILLAHLSGIRPAAKM